VLAALGVGIGPAVGDLLGRFHAIALFPYLAAIGGGMFVFRAVARRHRPVSSAADRRALLVLLSIAFLTGGIVFAHRIAANANGLTVFGDYDSVDLSYYAAITGELTHSIPPRAPFYSGHALNYSWYPQMLLALVHHFANVPTLLLYYRYAWPTLLALGALAGFVFVRAIASTRVALLAMTLLLVGGDFSYLFVWLLHPATYLFDWLLWPTNFLAPTMEVLHLST